MKIRFFTFEMYHGKRNIGSTRLRVHNLIKYWPETGIYKYGENPNVLIYQKVYCTQDYKFQHSFDGIQILDICDPDWFDGALIAETSNTVDGITCPTQPLADFIAQMTDKPIRVIPDRHDIELIPPPKIHTGAAKTVVWFGYKQNAELLQFAVPTLETLGLDLIVISNVDPMSYRYAQSPLYEEKYTFIPYDEATIYQDLQKADICILPQGTRPEDRFKSNNKTTKAWLAGLPVATDGDELRALLDGKVRQLVAKELHNQAIKEYDVRRSVTDMKEFIAEIQQNV